MHSKIKMDVADIRVCMKANSTCDSKKKIKKLDLLQNIMKTTLISFLFQDQQWLSECKLWEKEGQPIKWYWQQQEIRKKGQI